VRGGGSRLALVAISSKKLSLFLEAFEDILLDGVVAGFIFFDDFLTDLDAVETELVPRGRGW
jgi:hypothetical protein